MTPRQRFLETLTFGNPDKIPFFPGYARETTLERWHQEGLPKGVNYVDYIYEQLGLERPQTMPRIELGVSFQMIPTFQEKILEHKNGHYLVRDWMGNITEISDEYNYTYIRRPKDFVTRRWWHFPVTNRDEWEEMKTRYDAHDPKRFPHDFEERCQALQDRDYTVSLSLSGPFWQLREWVGFEGLCILMVEQPDWVHEMIDFWTEFISQTLAPILQRVAPDFVCINEDMAYKNHSMISPRMVREFLLPCWSRWASEMKAGGCPLIYLDSDGYVGELIPFWIEAGINVEGPNEVAAGCEVDRFYEQYGQQMAYQYGIDKRALAAGGQRMREEVKRRCSLLDKGGYIPGCDHAVPSDVPWDNFMEYSRLLAELCGWL